MGTLNPASHRGARKADDGELQGENGDTDARGLLHTLVNVKGYSTGGGWGLSRRADIYSPSPLNRMQECYFKWRGERFGLELRKTEQDFENGKIGTQGSTVCGVPFSTLKTKTIRRGT